MLGHRNIRVRSEHCFHRATQEAYDGRHSFELHRGYESRSGYAGRAHGTTHKLRHRCKKSAQDPDRSGPDYDQPHHLEPVGYCGARDGGPVDSGACSGEFHRWILSSRSPTGVHQALRRGASHHRTLCPKPMRAMRVRSQACSSACPNSRPTQTKDSRSPTRGKGLIDHAH